MVVSMYEERRGMIIVEHMGGPWDGMKERREISSSLRALQITQTAQVSVWNKAEQGKFPYLIHTYEVVRGAGRVLLMYAGVVCSATDPHLEIQVGD